MAPSHIPFFESTTRVASGFVESAIGTVRSMYSEEISSICGTETVKSLRMVIFSVSQQLPNYL